MLHFGTSLRRFFRLSAHMQLLPVLESGDDPLIGGQAVIEGVMMRAPHSYCVAVRRPDGEVVTQEGRLERPSEKYRLFGWPIFRGLGTIGQALALGIRTLRYSANEALPEEDKSKAKQGQPIPGWMMAVNVIFSLGFFIVLYKFVPLLLTTQIQNRVSWLDGQLGFSVVDGVIRLAIFLTFLTFVSRLKDIRRVFEFHGAEHKVVFNYESGEPVGLSRAQSFSTFHPRCGTSFLMVVMLVSIAVYALVPFEDFWPRLLARVALLPLIAGVSYEVIRFAARRQGSAWSTIVAPGLWLQRITTKNPADDQVEISIRALEGAMALEQEQNGELVVA